jgi:hypothetical protein
MVRIAYTFHELPADISVEFAFYVNRTGRRSRKEFMVYWEGTPTGFGMSDVIGA